MRPNASGITSANTSHTIGSSNVRRIFATRSSVDSITCDIIRRRSKIYSLPFFDFNVELLMRVYIGELILIIHWKGGIHTELHVRRRRRGQNSAQTPKDVVEAVRILARVCSDELIAGILTRNGLRTGR